MSIFKRRTFKVSANWKMVMDSMADTYHIPYLHKDSLGRFFVDAEQVIDQLGSHVRSLMGRGNFEKRLLSDDFEDARKVVVFGYNLVPNGLIVVSPDFVSIAVFKPISVAETEIDYFMLGEANPSAKLADKLQRSFDLMEIAFGQEDYMVCELGQAGLAPGALKHISLGGMELAIAMFHQEIDRLLQR